MPRTRSKTSQETELPKWCFDFLPNEMDFQAVKSDPFYSNVCFDNAERSGRIKLDDKLKYFAFLALILAAGREVQTRAERQKEKRRIKNLSGAIRDVKRGVVRFQVFFPRNYRNSHDAPMGVWPELETSCDDLIEKVRVIEKGLWYRSRNLDSDDERWGRKGSIGYPSFKQLVEELYDVYWTAGGRRCATKMSKSKSAAETYGGEAVEFVFCLCSALDARKPISRVRMRVPAENYRRRIIAETIQKYRKRGRYGFWWTHTPYGLRYQKAVGRSW